MDPGVTEVSDDQKCTVGLLHDAIDIPAQSPTHLMPLRAVPAGDAARLNAGDTRKGAASNQIAVRLTEQRTNRQSARPRCESQRTIHFTEATAERHAATNPTATGTTPYASIISRPWPMDL